MLKKLTTKVDREWLWEVKLRRWRYWLLSLVEKLQYPAKLGVNKTIEADLEFKIPKTADPR